MTPARLQHSNARAAALVSVLAPHGQRGASFRGLPSAPPECVLRALAIFRAAVAVSVRGMSSYLHRCHAVHAFHVRRPSPIERPERGIQFLAQPGPQSPCAATRSTHARREIQHAAPRCTWRAGWPPACRGRVRELHLALCECRYRGSCGPRFNEARARGAGKRVDAVSIKRTTIL
jgi:hypothetical protein